MALWLDDRPLILASRSQARRALLEGAGIPIEIDPADIDEESLAKSSGVGSSTLAGRLAEEKARHVAARHSGRLVLGADQTLELDGGTFSKPADRDAARAQLRHLRGREHQLHSGIAVARGDTILFHCVESARLVMRNFSDRFVEAYLDAAGSSVTASVGGYQIEGLGVQLFDRIEGDHATILGLPLLPILRFLREQGTLAS